MRDAGEEPVVVGSVAPWLLFAAACALTWFLGRELGKHAFDPSPLRYEKAVDVEVGPGRDAVTAPGPGAADVESRAAPPSWILPSTPPDELIVVVTGPDGRPAPWRHVGLRRRGETGSRAAYSDVDGEARIVMTTEFVADRAAGALEVFLRDPGRPDVAAPAPPNATRVSLVAPAAATARVVLHDGPGAARADRTPIVVAVEDGAHTEPSAYVVVGPTALIAGLPFDAPVRFVARPYGRATVERVAWFWPELGDVQNVSLPLEKPAAILEGEIPGGVRKGAPVRVATWSFDRPGEPFVAFSTVDDRGRWLVAAPPGVSVCVDVRTKESAAAPRLWNFPRLAAGVAAATPRIDDPPRTLRGVVTRPDSRPAVGALVVGAAPAVATSDDAKPLSAALTDDEGRFELIASVESAACRPQARYVDEDDSATYVADGTETAFGAADPVRLRLDQGGVVVGFFDGLPRDLLVGLASGGATIAIEDRSGVVVGFGAPALDGTFAVSAPAGVVRVRIRIPGVPPVFIEDVTVPAGGSVFDRRLRPASLPGPFEVARVRVERADAAPDADPLLRGALVVARFPDEVESGREPVRAYTESLGDVRIPYVKGSAPRFEVFWRDPSREDYALRSSVVSTVESGAPLLARLAPGAVVSFDCPAPRPEPPPVAIASFVLTKENVADPNDGGVRILSAPWLRGGGLPRFGSVPDGEWRVRLEVIREGDRRGAAVVDLGSIVVKPSDAHVVVPLDAAAASKALIGG